MIYRSGICNFCGTGCGTIQREGPDGITGILPRDKHPVSRGRLCLRGWHLHELLSTPDRINTASVRVGGVHEETAYRDAVAEAASVLSSCKPEETGFIASPQSSNEDIYAMVKLARMVCKSPNISVASDAGHSELLSVMDEGSEVPASACSIEDIKKADAILILGSDLSTRNPIIASEVLMAYNNGTHIVNVSAKPPVHAGKSSQYLKHIPGKSAVLLNAIARAMLENGISPVEEIHTMKGFLVYQDKLLSRDPLWYSDNTGIPWEEIMTAASKICEADNFLIIIPTGISGYDRETSAAAHNMFLLSGAAGSRSSGILPAAGISNITGAYDTGATHEYLPGYRKAGDAEASGELEKIWGGTFNFEQGKSVPELLRGGSSLKALVVSDYNEEIFRYIREYKSIEKIIFIGSYTNQIAERADIVIPCLNFIERDGTYTSTEHRVQINRGWSSVNIKGVHPKWKVCADIAAELNSEWKFNSFEDVFSEMITAVPQYGGITPEILDKGQGVQWDYDKEPVYKFIEMKDSVSVKAKEELGENEFVLVAGNAGFFWHKNEIMKKTYIPRREYNATLLLYPRGLVELSPEDAQRLGLRGRETVKIKSDSGEMSAELKINSGMRNRTANIPYFVSEAVPVFLLRHGDGLYKGEDFAVKVSIEKV